MTKRLEIRDKVMMHTSIGYYETWVTEVLPRSILHPFKRYVLQSVWDSKYIKRWYGTKVLS